MLRSNIRQFVSRSNCKMLEDMIARAREMEIDLEAEKNRKTRWISNIFRIGKEDQGVGF